MGLLGLGLEASLAIGLLVVGSTPGLDRAGSSGQEFGSGRVARWQTRVTQISPNKSPN